MLIVVATLAACSAPSGLAPGLTARMDAPGAQLDQREALQIINQLRASRGAPALVLDASLNAQAETLAANYAKTGTSPKKPSSVNAMRLSAGYNNFADTFSGWRSGSADTSALVDPENRRAGFGVAYNENSTYGVHWVLLLDKNTQLASQ